MKTFKIKLITPKQVVVEDIVDSISLPAKSGEITILKSHLPLFSLLKEGIIKLKKDKKEIFYSIGGGYVETNGNEVNVLVSSAYGQDEIDEQAIKDAQIRAKKIISETKSTVEREQALQELKRSIVDLKLINKAKRKAPQHN